MVEPFLIFGHRGSPTRFPENTPESFEEALRAGADGFETDLRLLSDQTPVLYHDDDCGEDPVESLSAAQLEERGAAVYPLTVLADFTGRALMVLEVKRAHWEERLLESVQRWPNAIIASFDHRVIASLHRRGVPLPLGVTLYGAMPDAGSYAAGLGAAWCFPGHRYVDRAMVRSLHEHGIRVVPWTPNRPGEWESLRALGCDGVITDVPHLAVAWRSRSAI